VQAIVELARHKQLTSLVLHPTDAARALYAEFGFKPADEMMLRPLGD